MRRDIGQVLADLGVSRPLGDTTDLDHLDPVVLFLDLHLRIFAGLGLDPGLDQREDSARGKSTTVGREYTVVVSTPEDVDPSG